MKLNLESSSSWMADFLRETGRGKHILLYGNIADYYLLTPQTTPGVAPRFITLFDFLREYLKPYPVAGRFDTADGLVPFDVSMQHAFTALGPQNGASLNTVPDGTEPSGTTINGLLGFIRRALAQNKTSTAFILDFADKLCSEPDRGNEIENPRLVLIRKMLLEAANVQDANSGAWRKNILILTASHLGMIPSWIYRDNPLIAVIQVKRPEPQERAAYLNSALSRFHGASELQCNDAVRAKAFKEFTELTEGLSARDLDAIRMDSVRDQISIANPKKLVNRYKFGDRLNPWETLDPATIKDASVFLERHISGQSAAVRRVSTVLKKAHVGIEMKEKKPGSGKPRGRFFFVGPTGVGKTEMSLALKIMIFGEGALILRLDMSEFREEHSLSKLIGSPPGYEGSEEGGILTNFVMRNPFSLILLDEIEKSHPKTLDTFLQILDAGRLTDSKGQIVDFSQTVIVFTSNIGSGAFTEESSEKLPDYNEVAKRFKKAVEREFTEVLKRPEILGRFGDDIVAFDFIRPESYPAIWQKTVKAIVNNSREARGLELKLDEDAFIKLTTEIMLRDGNWKLGGRRIETIVERTILEPLTTWVSDNDPPRGKTITIKPARNGAAVEINEMRIAYEDKQ